jgi:hypothetical protein
MAETKNNLDKKQKLALAGLTVFAVLMVVVWVVNLENEIKSSVTKTLAASVGSESNESTSSEEEATVDQEKLKNQDTDKDGLSDWDELYTYGTSPYISDSDSDDINDGTEVKNGTNPNCPQGQICNVATSANSQATSSSSISSSSIIHSSSTSSSTGTSTVYSQLLSGQITASSLRQLLISSGVSKTDLDKISDEDLMSAYSEQLASSSKKTSNSQK